MVEEEKENPTNRQRTWKGKDKQSKGKRKAKKVEC